MMRGAVSDPVDDSPVRTDSPLRPTPLLGAALLLALTALPVSARTARDLSARMRIDGYTSEFVPGDEDVFGYNAKGEFEEPADDSKWQNNEIYQIHLSWDAQYLYAAVDGKIWGNNMVLFFDTMPNRGLGSMTALNSWRRNVNFDTFGRFPGDEFMPDLFGATWDQNHDPRLITQVSGNQVDDQTVGPQFRAVATFDQGNDGRSMEFAIPWRNVFAGLSGNGGVRDTFVTVGGVADTLHRMPLGVQSIKVCAFLTAGWDGSGGPDSAPDNLRGHDNDGGKLVLLDNYAIIDLDEIDDTGMGRGGPDGIPDWGVSPKERTSFRFPPPITPLRFSIAELTLDRPAFRPDFADEVHFHFRLDPPLDPENPLDTARNVTLSANVYDASGRWVRNLFLNRNVLALDADATLDQAGLSRWDGRDEAGRLVPPGIYVLRLVIESNLDRATKAMVVVR